MAASNRHAQEKYLAQRQDEESLLGYGLMRRNAQVRRLVEPLLQAARSRPVTVVDFGCADGFMLRQLLVAHGDLIGKAVGLDVFKDGLPQCDHSQLQFRAIDIFRDLPFPFESGTVDIAIASAFFKHHPKPVEFLRECQRLLRPGGSLVLLDPKPWVVRVGFVLGHFEPRYNPNIWNRSRLQRLLDEAALDGSALRLSSYEHYWIAPNRKLYRLGIEGYVPAFLHPLLSLHQSALLQRY